MPTTLETCSAHYCRSPQSTGRDPQDFEGICRSIAGVGFRTCLVFDETVMRFAAFQSQCPGATVYSLGPGAEYRFIGRTTSGYYCCQ